MNTELDFDIMDAFNTFKALTPSFGPWDNESNREIMRQWFTLNCDGVQAGAAVSGWMIAWRECVKAGSLTQDLNHPHYAHQQRKAQEAEEDRNFPAFVDSLSAFEYGELYRKNENNFRSRADKLLAGRR